MLINSHVLVWVLDAPQKLGAKARKTLDVDPGTLSISVASPWELTIKQATGKIPPNIDFFRACEQLEIRLLNITAAHCRHAANLPLIHRDPFDRMIVAQAVTEGLALVTSDKLLRQYDVPIIRADQ